MLTNTAARRDHGNYRYFRDTVALNRLLSTACIQAAIRPAVTNVNIAKDVLFQNSATPAILDDYRWRTAGLIKI